MNDMFYEVRNVLSDLFGVPSSWFTGPQFITNLIVPYILTVAFFYVVLQYKVRIFRRGGAVNWVISVALAFFGIPLIVINPYAAIFMSVLAVVLLYGGGRITWKRMLLAGSLAVAAWFLAIWAPGFLMSVFAI